MKLISKAKGINEPIRLISRDIINIVKSQNYSNYFLPEDISNDGELMYDFYNEYKKFGVSRSYTIPTFSIELRYESDLNMGEPYMINGAVMDDDETISIVIIINPNHYPSLMYDLVADINDLVAHEIEHIFQNNNMRPDSEISSPKEREEPEGKEYYKQPHEVPAQIKGFKRISKLRKQPIKKVIEDWFSRSKYAHQLSDEDSSKVISHLVNYYNDKYKPETIEEGQVPSSIRRRINTSRYEEVLNLLKKAALRMLDRTRDGITLSDRNLILRRSFTWVAHELIPYDEEMGENYLKELVTSLSDEYGKQLEVYVDKIISTFHGSDDYYYVFKKHSQPNGGSGFSKTFTTWSGLIREYGYWMPLDWSDIKSRLDDRGESTIRISNPGEPTNTMGYFFSIEKILK